jgi:hypothetical protein
MTKRSIALVASLLFAVACPEGEPTEPTDPGPTCTTINSSFPQDGATNVYYRVTLAWEFAAADQSASVTVADADGNDVAGSGEWLGTTYIWAPSTPLTAGAGYTATMSYCDGANMPTTSFTVGQIGNPATPADLVGNTYQLDLSQDSQAQVVQPPGVGGTLQNLLADPANQIDILIGVEAADDSNVDLMGALGDGNNPLGQDVCVPTIPFPAAGFSENPFFSVETPSLTLNVLDNEFTLLDLTVNGAFSASGDRIAGATLSGTVDTRDLGPALNLGDAEDAVCTTVEPFGVDCEPCDDGQVFCLSALVTNIDASQVAGLELTEIITPSDDPTICPPTPDPAM